MAYDEDFPNLPKPYHVAEETWEACLSHYRAALARYQKAVIASGDDLQNGVPPTEDQRRAEDEARARLTIARTALIDLSYGRD